MSEILKLEKEIRELIEEAELKKADVVIVIESRTSEGLYNYGLDSIWIRGFSDRLSDSGGVITKEVTCGIYQQYSCYDVYEILEKHGFVKVYP